jgi:hypothetical protein
MRRQSRKIEVGIMDTVVRNARMPNGLARNAFQNWNLMA